MTVNEKGILVSYEPESVIEFSGVLTLHMIPSMATINCCLPHRLKETKTKETFHHN